MLNSWIL